jgi:hypothetical protein
VSKNGGTLSAVHEAGFGATSGDGRLGNVETIMADAGYRRGAGTFNIECPD